MSAYYNENDRNAAAWLRELIKAGLIADGEVDERSITEVEPSDVRRFSQCHFFAGIGVWSWALRNAGWSDDIPVWTGSCPCQGFSASGKRGGFSDKRHLWPAWFRLIRECRPNVCFGEQVASKDGLAWFDVVSSDLEGEGYAVGAADTCAAGYGAPHIRQRLYFVADSSGRRREQRNEGERAVSKSDQNVTTSILVDPASLRRERLSEWRSGGTQGEGRMLESARGGQVGDVGDPEGNGRSRRSDNGDGRRRECSSGQAGTVSSLGYTDSERRQQEHRSASGNEAADGRAGRNGCEPDSNHIVTGPVETNGFWRDAEWLWCKDGKYRPTKPGIFPLAHGIRGRVGLLRGAGNALCAPAAQAFIEAYMETVMAAIARRESENADYIDFAQEGLGLTRF